jgi:mRNA-degrading endonuclease YafQ of YafQ-DinJ toxin-antitoxin module
MKRITTQQSSQKKSEKATIRALIRHFPFGAKPNQHPRALNNSFVTIWDIHIASGFIWHFGFWFGCRHT